MSDEQKTVKTLQVQGAGRDSKVAFWEKNELHPEGEVFITNNGQAVEVAETPAVKRAIAEGRITTEINNWNTKKKTTATTLRPATEEEEDAAGLTTDVEKKTAVVAEPIRRGARPS
jgi:hypothetical protein